MAQLRAVWHPCSLDDVLADEGNEVEAAEVVDTADGPDHLVDQRRRDHTRQHSDRDAIRQPLIRRRLRLSSTRRKTTIAVDLLSQWYWP
ncbi:hypothetical protein OHA72_56250 [Dactylosporangium sp. NBC_01737]|uniref:hypothetical protein n=1 Tax=Dactylosporangium sp. NBC_01737 TaxID=2975959 RepID=UPI002E12EF13|nr:hypothetical protein OHA72_56250 [Dactylosporangium sp. NBC_01737]